MATDELTSILYTCVRIKGTVMVAELALYLVYVK